MIGTSQKRAQGFSLFMWQGTSRQYLVSLGRYKEGMTVHAISDSTLDFHNWDNNWKWVGKGDEIFKEGFAQHGFALSRRCCR